MAPIQLRVMKVHNKCVQPTAHALSICVHARKLALSHTNGQHMHCGWRRRYVKKVIVTWVRLMELEKAGEKVSYIRYTNDSGEDMPYIFADTPMANRLSGLTQIRFDLVYAQELMSTPTDNLPVHVSHSLWVNAVILYGKCFASAEGRKIKLEEHHVRKYNEDALDYHRSLLDLRNQYICLLYTSPSPRD